MVKVMDFKLVLAFCFLVGLLGCSKQADDVSEAISLSRDGVSLLSQSNEEGVEDSKKIELSALGLEKLKLSKTIYIDLLADDPENGMLHNNYGWVQLKIGELQGAKESFREAMKYKNDVHPLTSLENNIKELESLLSTN